MNETKKHEIKSLLRTYVDRMEGQNKAAHTMAGVSPTTLSNILNEKWDRITKEMWLKVAYYVGWQDTNWKSVETRDYQLLVSLLEDARRTSTVYGIVGRAGVGKSFTLRKYAKSTRKVYLLQCSEYWNRKNFLEELMTQIGRDYRGLRASDMVDDIIRQLKKQHQPLIILDEADKLNDSVMYFFITIYNKLEDQCGIVLCATEYLEKKILKGVRMCRKGYNEIYSRIGRKFIHLNGVCSSDVMGICVANGVTEEKVIKKIWTECEEDLRRVKRSIQAYKKAN